MVKQVQLSENGPSVSDVIYGTWRILDDSPRPSVEELAERFEQCLELGIDTLDTAEIYGLYTVEAAIGEVFAARPDLKEKFKVVTKFGIDVPSDEKSGVSLPHYNATAANMIACAEKSLRLLNIDSIDLFLVHRPDWFTSADETASGLNELLAKGTIKHAGVSNYTRDQFELLNSRMDQPLVTNQVEVSLLHMDALYDGTLTQAEQLRVRPMAWSPLAGGKLFDADDEAAQRIREKMDEISPKYGDAGYDALAFAWVMAHPSQPATIIGSNQWKRIQSQASASAIELDRQDWYALWSAAKGHPIP